MQILFEILFKPLLDFFLVQLGVFVRWCLRTGVNTVIGKPTDPFKRYAAKRLNDRDPSNNFSDRLINIILGALTIALMIWLLVLVVD